MKFRKPKKLLKVRKKSFVNKMNYVDYKDIELLKKFINQHGSIIPRRISGASARHQRMVSIAIKRARIMALLPFANPRIRKTKTN